MKLPALLVNADMRRRMAKDKVRKAIDNIKVYGIAAGFSERTIHEFTVLVGFMESEITKNEQRSKEEVDTSSNRRELSSNYANPV